MPIDRVSLRCVFVLFLGVLASGHAAAQATRTWVSGVGDDVNPCSRTAPCKTFAGAISKTAPGGTIDVLDPGGFGGVTITKSITLENVGAIGGILASASTGIIVNDSASPTPGTAVVVLRGLSIDGNPPSANSLAGVRFLSGGELIVERSDIGGFANATNGSGINFNPSTSAKLVVRDTTIHNNGSTLAAAPGDAQTSGGGIMIRPQSGRVDVVLDNVRVVNGPNFGIIADGSGGTIQASIRNSVVSGFTGNGIWAFGGTNAVNVTLDNVTVSGNKQIGLLAQGANAQIRTSDSTITGNATGMQGSGGGAIVSFGDNRNYGNVVNGAPNSSVPKQ